MVDLEIRRAREDETDAVVALAGSALGWQTADPNRALFTWKHLEGPFGRSPMWVAVVDGELAGFRTFLRWRFRDETGRIVSTVRAVDTATHPDHQGRGIFRALTERSLTELRDEGIDFVFNTPNEKSRPGYLKMGWQVVGRVPIQARATSWRSLRRMAGARVPASKWSLADDRATPAAEVLSRTDEIETLLGQQPPDPRISTDLSPAFLQWRFAFEPLAYRAVVSSGGASEGLAVFRRRRRGTAIELTLALLLTASPEPGLARDLVERVAAAAPADYLVRTGTGVDPGARFLPVPHFGPILTWRALNRTICPPLDRWALTLGDLELF